MKKLFNLRCISVALLLLGGLHLSAQSSVSGVVTDGTNGEAIPGVNIVVKGTTDGTVTDLEGMYTVNASQGDVLAFSFVGFRSQEVTVGASATMDVSMSLDATRLNEFVVTATRRPVRKLQATTAISSVGKEEIAMLQPGSFTEAIQNTPGITINESQGRKGGFTIRGFPGGNVYTTTLIDGLPASGIAGLSSGTQEFFGIDPNVERIEVVRGAAATLFGRAAGAGAINIISKTGGEKTKGSISFTKFSNTAEEGHQFEGDFDYRLDFNVNGPLADNLYYNIGGYLLEDSGTKEQVNKDKGAQIRANIDWIISETSRVRFFGSAYNNQFQNNTDSPWNISENKIPDGWTSSIQNYNDASQLDFVATAASRGVPIINQSTGQPIENNPSQNKEDAVGNNIGIDATFDLGKGWTWNEKIKYSNIGYDDINIIGLTGFYNRGDNMTMFNGSARQQNSSWITESRLDKFVEGSNASHNFTFGLYYSNADRDRLGLNYFHRATAEPRPVFSGFGPSLGTTFGISGTSSHREEESTAFFFGDEMTFGDNLSVNLAFRYDWLRTLFSNNPENISRVNIDYDPAETTVNELKFKDYSWSAGVNYLLGENSAVYGNYLRAFSLPSINLTTDVQEKNEIINNLELGYRAGLGDLTLDFAFFNTRINNRVAFVFDGAAAEFKQVPGGSNKILGGELALTYAPSAIKGLLFRASYTYQNSEYVNFVIPLSISRTTGLPNADLDNLFGLELVGAETKGIDVAGKRAQGTPKHILNLSVSYSAKRWGTNFGGFNYSDIYADAFNLYKQPNLSIYNFGAHIKFPVGGNDLKVGFRIKNVFDGASVQGLLLSSSDDSGLIERQNNPNAADRLAFAVYQNPRRLLLTVGYDF